MGLDMYLFKAKENKDFPCKVYVDIVHCFRHLSNINSEKLKDYFKDYSYEKEGFISLQVAYWRKANMVHRYLYENRKHKNIKDFEPMYIEKEVLEKLLYLAHQVMKEKDNILAEKEENIAKELLPTQSGFFFGSTEYNNMYFDDIELTIKQIEQILSELKAEEFIYYYANY
jgi:hypothetical protein